MKNFVLSIASLLCFACSHTSSRVPSSDGIGQLDDSTSLSQLIRSNTKHYWGWAKENQHKYSGLSETLNYSGLVFGDPHMGNFAPYLVKDLSGKSSVQFVPVDFDDVGEAPFILDVVRYIVATEAVDKKSVKKTAVLEAYIKGLNNPYEDYSSQLPDLVRDRLSTPVKDVLAMQAKYVDKKTSKGKFKLEKDSLESYDGDFKSAINNVLKPLTTLDIVQRVVLRGGSKDALRLWALTKNQKKGLIFEFKQWQQSGVDAYTPQSSIAARLENIYNIFWPNLDPKTYTIVKLNTTEFWLREKHESLLDIPYSVNSDAERVFVSSYAQACATVLGQIHGRQKAGQEFAEYIKKVKITGLKAIIEPMASDYLRLMEQNFNK